MSGGVRLTCPLCGAAVAEGAEPEPGRCPGCGAAFAGGGEDPAAGVARALGRWGAPDMDAPALARRLFESEPPAAPAPGAAITSDRRDGFYLWWVFVREEGRGPAAVLRALLGG